MIAQRSLFVLLLGLGSAAAAACYVGPLEKEATPATETSPTEADRDVDGDGIPDGHGDGVGSGGGGGTPTDPAAGNASGLPCDVDTLLAQKCRTCHGAKPRSPMSLLTYEDLVAPSKSDPSKSVAALSLERMKDLEKPMPPNKSFAATANELAAFDRWLVAGLPAGTCAKPDAGTTSSGGTTSGGTTSSGGTTPGVVDAGTDAGARGGTCSTGLMWTSRDSGSRMNPGRACIGCHTNFAGRPILQIGGTVYETLNEVDRCYGTQVPAYVVVKDATGRSVTLTTGATGNFTLSSNVTPLVYPISVKVVRNGKENAMLSNPPHGDCNACHTENGKNGAPGRILMP